MLKTNNILSSFPKVFRDSIKILIIIALTVSVLTVLILNKNRKYFEVAMLVETDILRPESSKDLSEIFNKLIDNGQFDVLSKKMNINRDLAVKIKDIKISHNQVSNIIELDNVKNFFYITVDFWEGGNCNAYQDGIKYYFDNLEYTIDKRRKLNDLYDNYNNIIESNLHKVDSVSTTSLRNNQSVEEFVNKYSFANELKSKRVLNSFSKENSSSFIIFDSSCSNINKGFSNTFIIVNSILLYIVLCLIFISFKVVLKIDEE
jgi:hypothetical protein